MPPAALRRRCVGILSENEGIDALFTNLYAKICLAYGGDLTTLNCVDHELKVELITTCNLRFIIS